MGKAYRLRFFGPVQVDHADEPVRGFESHKAIALLGYLAAHDQPITRSFLANLFWETKTETRGRGNLKRVIHNLNSLLPACLNITRDAVQFQIAEAYWLDTRAFDELCARGDAAALAAALELYRGEFMAGIFLDDCPEFETWLVVERERWQQRASQVLQTLIAYHTARGECAPALRLVACWLDLDPWREEAHRQKMLLLALNGQRTDALAQYATCRRILADELHAAPSRETTTLFTQIRDGAIAPLPPPPVLPPHNLPAPLTPFVGRAEELAKIAARLANPDCRLITLVGPGGIGKTRLALGAARAHLHAFADGAYFVPLAAAQSHDAIASAIARAIKFTLRGATDPLTQLCDYLRDKTLLLLLDNFEHLRDDPTWLVTILQRAPRVKILVTSRERLDLQAEWRLEIEGLAYPDFRFQISDFRLNTDARALENLKSEIIHLKFPAMALFAQSAQRVNADFALEPEWAGTLRICQLVRGMPLALELAGAATRDFSSAAIADQIERNLGFLATTMRDVPERHRSMRAVFDHSWHLLAEPEQRAFRRLAIFRGGFDADAADAINSPAAASDRITNYELRITDLIASLIAKSLVQQDATGRYEMHELVRQYAELKLQEAGEQDAIQSRHLDYFVALAEHAHQQLFGGAQETWFARLEEEYDNIRAAFEWASRRQENRAGLRLAVALRRFWLTRGYWVEGMCWLEQMLPLHRAPSPLRTQALNAAGNLAVSLGNYARATALYEEALAQSQEQGDQSVIAGIFSNLGLLAKMRGDLARAEEFHNAGFALRQQLGDKPGMASSALNLGNILSEQGNHERAMASYQQSLDLYRALQDVRGMSIALNNLGNAYLHQGAHEQAKNSYTESLTLARKLNSQPAIANTLTGLSVLARRQGEYAQAAKFLVESLTLARDIGDKHQIAATLEAFAFLASAQAQPERAARLLGAADALHHSIGDPRMRFDWSDNANHLAALRAALGEDALAMHWAAGRATTLDQAIAYALERSAGC